MKTIEAIYCFIQMKLPQLVGGEEVEGGGREENI